jgi:hypothetical protein
MLTMLTKPLSVFAVLPLASAGVVALTQAPAAAAPCRGRGGDTTDCKAVVRVPGRHRSAGPSGSGGGDVGTIAPDPCASDPACAAATMQGPPAAPVSTADMVQTAMASMTMPKPELFTSPKGRTYVGVPTFFWIDQAQWQPQTAVAPAGGQTVTARATPTAVQWNLGETTLTCQGPGTAYDPAGPETQTSDCSYRYQRSSAGQPGKKYQISATISWSVEWTCAGAGCTPAAGQLPAMASTSFAQLPVGEIQTNSQPG